MEAVLENEMESTIPIDRGFNKNIKWMTLADAEVESRARLICLFGLIGKIRRSNKY